MSFCRVLTHIRIVYIQLYIYIYLFIPNVFRSIILRTVPVQCTAYVKSIVHILWQCNVCVCVRVFNWRNNE